MKRLLFLLLSVSFLACTETKKKVQADTSAVVQAVSNPVSDSAAIPPPPNAPAVYEPEAVEEAPSDSINFQKYAVSVNKNFEKAPLDFSSNPGARYFRTRIIEAYKGNTIDFAGHYVGVVFGCGASCIMGFMIDVRDGKIYNSPLGEENMCFWALDMNICRPKSRLFISAICKETEESKTVYYKSYVWNEEQKKFERVDSKEFIKSN